MSSSKDNNIYKKTSFLTGVNYSFIEKFYSDYLSNPEELPKDWKLFFETYLYRLVRKLSQWPVGRKEFKYKMNTNQTFSA